MELSVRGTAVAEQGNREKEIFEGALDCAPGEERQRYLESACDGDTVLLARIQALLRADDAGEDFLSEEPKETTNVIAEKPGDQIGRYRLLEKIGEGGCGVVYVAEQSEPLVRRVALKIIKLGMDTKSVIARFEAERQALALMDHPNIARVLDDGATSTGRPYFVMELVGGIKITDYCEQNHLNARQRLDMFIQVCRAIQHAHQKGVIHRDIKPSNVLVATQDGVSVPKVIDFGIAKVTQGRLTNQTVFTAFEQFLGTPAYMSPEQAQLGSLDVDTRSDIYSLGVLLYELLTGKTPFDTKELLAVGLDAVRKTICEKEPPTPSMRLAQERSANHSAASGKSKIETPKSEIDRDLDWIVMKCLEKDRARRYETANGLARDIERHLKDEPVVARPPSNLYRLQKLVYRNKVVFASAAAVALALVLGLGLSTWLFLGERASRREQARLRQQAQTERVAAQTEAAKRQQVAQFLKDMLAGVGPSKALGRDTTMLKEILDKTAERVGKELTNQPQVEAEMRATLAETYGELGLYKQEEAMAHESLRLARSAAGEGSRAVVEALSLVRSADYDLGNFVQAEATAREVLDLLYKFHGKAHSDIAAALNNLGLALNHQRKLTEATTTYRQALGMQRKLKPFGSLDEADTLCNLGYVLNRQGKFAEAEELERASLAMQRKLQGSNHPNEVPALLGLAYAVRKQGKLVEAEAMGRETLTLQRKLLGNDHPEVRGALGLLADVLTEEGKLVEAETVSRESLTIARRVLGDTDIRVAESLSSLADVLKDEGKPDEAVTAYEEALAIFRKALGNEHEDVVTTLGDIGNVLRNQGKFAEAENRFRESLAGLRKLKGDEDSAVATALVNLSLVLIDQEKLTEAEPFSREAIGIYRKHHNGEDPDLALTLVALGKSLSGQGKLVEAESLFREALARLRKAFGGAPFGGAHPRIAQSLNNLALNLAAQSKLNEAETLAREALAMVGKVQGEHHPDVVYPLNTLALILQDQSKWSEAESLYRDNLPAMRTQLSPDSRQLAVALVQLAYTLLMEGKFAEAEMLGRECLAIREKTMPDDWLTFGTRSLVGGTLLAQKRYAEAEPLLLSGYEGMREREQHIPLAGKPRLKEALQRVVELYEATGRLNQSVQWRQRLDDFESSQTNRPSPTPPPAKL
jgi:serine/threonine protein kinase/Tfp pilus assembly protein PilF